MTRLLILMFALAVGAATAEGQPGPAPSPTETPAVAPGSSGDRGVIQHGAQPNPGEVRPPSPQGDAPSASVGTLERDSKVRQIFGLPVTTVIVIAGVIVAIAVVGRLAVPRVRRRRG